MALMTTIADLPKRANINTPIDVALVSSADCSQNIKNKSLLAFTKQPSNFCMADYANLLSNGALCYQELLLWLAAPQNTSVHITFTFFSRVTGGIFACFLIRWSKGQPATQVAPGQCHLRSSNSRYNSPIPSVILQKRWLAYCTRTSFPRLIQDLQIRWVILKSQNFCFKFFILISFLASWTHHLIGHISGSGCISFCYVTAVSLSALPQKSVFLGLRCSCSALSTKQCLLCFSCWFKSVSRYLVKRLIFYIFLKQGTWDIFCM